MTALLDSGPLLIAVIGVVAGLVGVFISLNFQRVVTLQKGVLKQREDLIENSVGISKVYRNEIGRLANNPDLEQELQRARRRIRLFAITGRRILSQEYIALKGLLEKGVRMEVMLLDPTHILKQFSSEVRPNEMVQQTFSILADLARSSRNGGELEVRLYSSPQPYTLLFVDDLLFVSLDNSPMIPTKHMAHTLLIKDSDTPMFRLFDTLFEQSWRTAKSYQLNHDSEQS